MLTALLAFSVTASVAGMVLVVASQHTIGNVCLIAGAVAVLVAAVKGLVARDRWRAMIAADEGEPAMTQPWKEEARR